jgi:hypothetical protein
MQAPKIISVVFGPETYKAMAIATAQNKVVSLANGGLVGVDHQPVGLVDFTIGPAGFELAQTNGRSDRLALSWEITAQTGLVKFTYSKFAPGYPTAEGTVDCYKR